MFGDECFHNSTPQASLPRDPRPEANAIRTDYMANNSPQMSDRWRQRGGSSCPGACDLVPDLALVGGRWVKQ